MKRLIGFLSFIVALFIFIGCSSSQREILTGSSHHWEVRYEFIIYEVNDRRHYQDCLDFKYKGTDLKPGDVITYELLENGDQTTGGHRTIPKNGDLTFGGGCGGGNGSPPSLDYKYTFKVKWHGKEESISLRP